jgi:hypothetical protein
MSEELNEITHLQKLRNELSGSLKHLPDYQIIQLCQDYGITYDMPDANSIRILMLLSAAEQLILHERAQSE